MRLLELDHDGRFILRQYSDSNVPPYAILSHTWARDSSAEVLYQDLLAGTASAKPQFRKLEFCRDCAYAEELSHFWIDTCCIDKTDSVELSESINSMYRWYQNARCCYVYLEGVLANDRDAAALPTAWRDTFRDCRWFQRGWTLQELLAPPTVKFFSEDNVLLGDKNSLQAEIVEATGLPSEALLGTSLHNFGIDERFGWAATRQTTKVEDESYCLLGLFNVFLPLIYGEGRDHARKRLQKEVEPLKDRDLKVLDWLSPLRFAAQLQDFISNRATDTGTWFLKHNLFADWLDRRGETLFCPGMPGAGKTMIASVVVSHLQTLSREQSYGVAYVFCSYGDSSTHKAVNLLAAMLKQLAIERHNATQTIQALYDKHAKQETRPTISEIFEGLKKTCGLFSRVAIIVDALDECRNDSGQRDLLIQRLFDLQRTANINLMFTSRFDDKIEERYARAGKIEIHASDEDVRQYVMERIPGLPSFVLRSEELQMQICDKIATSADGMFLLVRFYVDALRNKTTIKKLKTALKDFGGYNPLNQAYEEARKRIEQQAEEHRELAQQVLSWLTYAQRPLTINELRHALAVEPGESHLDSENMPDVSEIVSSCAGLATVNEGSGVIRLVHYTTQEYLEQIRIDWLPGAQKQIATACIAYLSLQTFQSGRCKLYRDLVQRLEQFALFDYAAQYFGHHLRAVQQEVNCDLVLKFLRKPALVRACLQRLFVWMRRAPKNFAALHLVAYMDLQYFVDVLLQSGGSRADEQDNHGKTPLMYAAQQGHADVVRKLLESGTANINLQDNSESTALWFAAGMGRHSVVQILLDSDQIDVNLKDEDAWTPLMAACQGGHLEIVELLLATNKADVDSANWKGRTALFYAARRGHTDIARRLVETRMVDICRRDQDDWTSLSVATYEGHDTMVEYLLAINEIEVDVMDKYGKSAFMYAADHGHVDIVKRLMLTGQVNIDSKDNNGWTPLMFAAANGHTEIVKLLLSTGKVNVKQALATGETALDLAVEFKHNGVSQLLSDTTLISFVS